MTSLLVSSTHQPLSSSSQPSSPIEEEDLSKRAIWENEDSQLVSSKWKGKGKAPIQADDEDEEEDNEIAVSDGSHVTPTSYPPLDEEELETRRVEENLRRLAAMERDRRKKARESRTPTSSKPDPASRSSTAFSVSEVGRRASELWSGKDKMRPDGTQHRALSSIDESVPAGPPSLSPNPTDEGRSSSPGSAAPSSPTPSSVSTNNPFEDPRYTLSENGNGGGESIPINTLNNSRSKSGRVNSKRRAQSPPRPLGLPDPVSLEPAAGEARRSEMEQEEGPTVARRWWTDWLCGCREEADEQAGRTNPME